MKKRFDVFAICTVLSVVLVVGLGLSACTSGTETKSEASGPLKWSVMSEANAYVTYNGAQYRNERIVVPDNFVGDALDSVNVENASGGEDKVSICEVEFFDSKSYVAVPIDGNYYLFQKEGSDKIIFDTGMMSLTMSPEIPDGLEGSQSAAYFSIIKKVAELWQGRYMAIDPKNINVDNPAELIKMTENYCFNQGMMLIISDFEGLKERGHIDIADDGLANGFNDGYHITFDSAKLSKKKLVADAGCWYGSLGAEGGTYTALLKDGEWVVDDKVSNMWIS
jgi:hypothetical protein